MQLLNYPAPESLEQQLRRPLQDTASLEERVETILKDVKRNGQKAVDHYTEVFDKVKPENILVGESEFKKAETELSPDLKQAIRLAKSNIERFHSTQKETAQPIETMNGVRCWRKPVAIEKVGLYIPGGSAPLFSTVLMLGVPAKLAGCRDIILCSPPDASGNLNPAILYAARLTGITQVFKTGGVQAIGAMAYGTEIIPKVYKLFGPGNQYVTCAKQLISKEGIAIDMPAGPSELMIIADDTAVPAFVAADLLSQAEHGPDSQVILISNSKELIQQVDSEITKQLSELPRKAIAAAALENSKSILVTTLPEAVSIANTYAPEHLILACKDEEKLAEDITNAGSVFLGNYSCESAGDYASGTNHTLPTNGYARAFSGVSLDSFVKKITFQKISVNGIQAIGPAIELMAEAEGLQAHRNAVTIRLTQLRSNP